MCHDVKVAHEGFKLWEVLQPTSSTAPVESIRCSVAADRSYMQCPRNEGSKGQCKQNERAVRRFLLAVVEEFWS